MIINPNDPPPPQRADSSEGQLKGFNVVRKRYSQVRDIFAEFGNETALLLALERGHGIKFDSFRQDPFLHFVLSEEQQETMKRFQVNSPTWLQLLGTSEIVALTEEEAIKRFRELKGDPRA